MTTAPSFSWNIVTKNFHAHEQLQVKFRQKITKLQRYLQHFPPDAVHLQIAMDRHARKPIFTAALTLRLPSNILHSRKAAPDPVKAFDHGVAALLRELESLKSDLRGDAAWRSKPRRHELKAVKAAAFALVPLPPGTGPQDLQDLVSELLRKHYRRLLRHARRRLRHDRLNGDIPEGLFEPRAIVDEVALRALREHTRKPADLGYVLWFYALLHQELRRRRQACKGDLGQGRLPDQPAWRGGTADTPANYDPQQNLDPFREPLEQESEDESVPAPSLSPDVAVQQEDLLEEVQTAVQTWPRLERDIFELHFVEGLEPDEIAMVSGQTLGKVEETIQVLHRRVRQFFLGAAQS